MTEDQHGVIWSATYPQTGLASFDPKTGQFNDYGHLYKQNWAEYPRSVAVDDAGWVYCGVGTAKADLVAFKPATRSAEGPMSTPRRSWPRSIGTPMMRIFRVRIELPR